ncbi:flavin monoamine oxidase family protein [Streptomyces barringtoniae]|uniref:flavin monoamine oxidase family protein n=1 Tax=Streptomyces barringtoniae TaxID=2892029 RepID=UPI001E3CDB7E|nr:flavin monoamine oxidase family protein [Streptomyces barringtoniae]MCC5478438.1 flavin monoamine oxidase family protein [Streptomyces barringtoniae]
MPENYDTDVVIVGAGLAGLTVGRTLHAQGVDVLVLEARDRVGGRTCSVVEDDGRLVEYGGQWIGPTQDRINALVEEFGLTTFTQYSDGDNLQRTEDGRLLRYHGAIPTGDPVVAADLMEAMVELTALAAEVGAEAPWTHPQAAVLDATTVESWIGAQPYCDGAKEWLRAFTRALFPAEPGEVSLLHALFYIASGGGVERMIGVINSAQETRLSAGAMGVSLGLAGVLGDRVRLSCPVHRIDQDESGVVVHHEQGRVRARYAVVAVPPPLAGRLRYSPALPGLRDQLTQRVFMGSAIKTTVVYPEPFWRADGLSGHSTGHNTLTFDQSHPDRAEGVLVSFTDCDAARRALRMSPEERQQQVVAELVSVFGPKAAQPIATYEKVWLEEEWSRGCYTGILSPGTWSTLGPALREPVGRIHWAGTEYATVWSGYMDGAVRSGEQAAAAVAAELGVGAGLSESVEAAR